MSNYSLFNTSGNQKMVESSDNFNEIFNFNKPTQQFGSNFPFDTNFNHTVQPKKMAYNPNSILQKQENYEHFTGFGQSNFNSFEPNYLYPPGIMPQQDTMPDNKQTDWGNNIMASFDNDYARPKSEKLYGDPNSIPNSPFQRPETTSKMGYNSISPMVGPTSRPVTQIKPTYSPQINSRPVNNLPSMVGINRPGSGKGQKRSSLPATKIEEIMNTIENLKINPISLLNEISTKIKKKVEYIMSESPFGKIRVFECSCKLDKETVGSGKGNSKQAAKNEAAKEGVKTLLSKESYMPERAAIILSVQKISASGQFSGNGAPYFPTISPADSPNLGPSTREFTTMGNIGAIGPITKLNKEINSGSGEFNKGSLDVSQISNDSDHLNESPLYELNLIAKESSIEPIWKLTLSPNQEGDFEAEIKFEKLVGYGKGRKKQDAKREAASQIISQIRSNSTLKDKFNPKPRSKLGRPGSQILDSNNKEKKKKLFETSLESKFFDDLAKDNFSRDNLNKSHLELEEHINSLVQKYSVEFSVKESLNELFKKVENYTSMSVAFPRQVLLNAEKHLVDLVADCSLIPVGSFAYDCLRSDKLVIDSIITFHERSTIDPICVNSVAKSLSDMEFLELYKASLEDCQKMAKDTGTMAVELSFKIIGETKGEESSSEEYFFLEISEKNKTSNNKMRVFVSNTNKKDKNALFMGKYDFTIVHLRRVYQCFESYTEEFKIFKKLLIAMRIWRERSETDFLRPEIIDIILLYEFINTNTKGTCLSGNIFNCLMALGSDEHIRRVLRGFDPFYLNLLEETDESEREDLRSAAHKTLECISKEKYTDGFFS